MYIKPPILVRWRRNHYPVNWDWTKTH